MPRDHREHSDPKTPRSRMKRRSWCRQKRRLHRTETPCVLYSQSTWRWRARRKATSRRSGPRGSLRACCSVQERRAAPHLLANRDRIFPSRPRRPSLLPGLVPVLRSICTDSRFCYSDPDIFERFHLFHLKVKPYNVFYMGILFFKHLQVKN